MRPFFLQVLRIKVILTKKIVLFKIIQFRIKKISVISVSGKKQCKNVFIFITNNNYYDCHTINNNIIIS